MKIKNLKKALKITILMTVIFAFPIVYSVATDSAISYTLSEDKQSAIIHIDVDKFIGNNELVEVKDQDNNVLTEYDMTVTENGTYSYIVTYKEAVIKETDVMNEEAVDEVTVPPETQDLSEMSEMQEEVLKSEKIDITVEGILEMGAQETSIIKDNSQGISSLSETTDESLFSFTPSTGTITEFKGDKLTTNVVIPSEIGGVPVKIIGNMCFYSNSVIESVTIPDSVESIQRLAFGRCPQLTNVYLGEGLVFIDSEVFLASPLLEKIEIPDSVTSIGAYCFSNCTGLKSVRLSEKIQSLPDSLFRECESLQTIHIPESVTSIGEHTFSKCKSLKDILLPKNLTNLGFRVFEDCISLTEIEIPDTVTFMDRTVFWCCTGLKSVKLPNKITNLPLNTFMGCSSLTDIVLPPNIQYLDTYSLGMCTSLENVTLTAQVVNDGGYNEEEYQYFGVFLGAFVETKSLKRFLIICQDENELEMNKHQLYNIDSLKKYNPDINIYRGTIQANIENLKDNIYSIKDSGKIINLKDVFKKDIQQKIYKGETGTEIYTGDDVQIPDDYFNTSMQYILEGNPTSSQTRIENNLLYIGADETSSDLTIGLQYNTHKIEVPIVVSAVDSIEIKDSVHNDYADGEAYNPNGLVITVHYADGTVEDIEYNELTAPLFQFSDSQLSWDKKDIIIEFGGKSVTQDVDVYKETAVGDSTGTIGMDGQLTHDTTIVNKPIEKDNELLDGIDEKQVIGEKEYIISGSANGDIVISYEAGEKNNGKTVYIQYKDKHGEIKVAEGTVANGKVEVTINDPTSFIIYMDYKDRVEKINIKSLPKVTYNQREYYNPDGLSLTIIYTDGTEDYIVYNQETKHDFGFLVYQLEPPMTKQVIKYKGIQIEHNLKVISEYHEIIIKDEKTNVTINGNFTEGSYSVIGKVEDISSIEGLEGKEIIGKYEAHVVGEYEGKLFVTFDVDAKYNGRVVYIRHQKSDGSFETLKATVMYGVIGINVEELGEFVIYAEEGSGLEILPEIKVEQDSIRTSIVITSDMNNLGMLGVVIGIALTSWIFVLRKKRCT